jgi:membrane protein DedA with SNARE-associated domain
MNSKKNFQFFALVFPVAFAIGILVSLSVSLQTQESIEINWLVVVIVAIVLDALLTWRNSRESGKSKDAS